jgi:WD40 repeat protein
LYASGDLEFALQGDTIAVSTLESIEVWNLSTGKLLQSFPSNAERAEDGFGGATLSPNGKLLVSTKNVSELRLHEVDTGQTIRTFGGSASDVLAIAASGTGILASGSDDDSIKLWSASTGQLLKKLTGHKGAVCAIAFSPNGPALASGSQDKTVRIWDAISGQVLQTFTGHQEGVCALAFSPDGSRILSADTENAQLWEVASGKSIRAFRKEEDSAGISSVALSTDGRRAAISSSHNGKVRVFDLVSGRQLSSLKVNYTRIEVPVGFSTNDELAVGEPDKLSLWTLPLEG